MPKSAQRRNVLQMKDCQFCGESIKDTAYHCNHCNQTQRDQLLLSIRLIRIQVVRYLTFFLALSAPLGIITLYIGEFETSMELLHDSIKMFAWSVFGLLMLPLIAHSLPKSFFSDVKVPYTIERIKHCRRMMFRNLLLYPVLSAFFVYGQIKLIVNRPNFNDFRTHLKTEKSFSEKDITDETAFLFFTVHMVANTKKGSRVFAGINNKFYSFDPQIFIEFIERRSKINSKIISKANSK